MNKRGDKHFFGYHNRDKWGGPYYPEKAIKGAEHCFVTGKQFRKETLIGQRMWAFEGSGSPRRYRLVSSGTINRATKWKRPSQFRKAGREYGTRVYFKIDVTHDPIDVTKKSWLKKLRKQFRNGFSRLGDESIVRSLELLWPNGRTRKILVDREWPRVDELADIEHIKRTVKNKTTREALIDARLGQGKFRTDVVKRWSGRCAVTGCGLPAMLRASHIKPWSQCSNRERLNPSNGILLAAHIDALFDRGLISFKNNGSMLLSEQIKSNERRRFRLPKSLRHKPTSTERQFLLHHRNYQFMPQ